MQSIMKVGPKGQVVVPQELRMKMNITPGAPVRFVEEDGRLYLERVANPIAVFEALAKKARISDIDPHEAYEGSIERK